MLAATHAALIASNVSLKNTQATEMYKNDVEHAKAVSDQHMDQTTS
jgi:hypothetical protein